MQNKILTIVAEWTEEGNVYFVKDNLPVNL